jgi:hypothetical protein
MKQFGVYLITYEQMERYLNLPEDHNVVDIIEFRNRMKNAILVKVKGPRMYKVPEGQEIPIVPLDHLERKENED